MPIFEYRCSLCETRFETLVSRAEAGHPQPCPACGAAVGGKDRPEDRLLSVFAAAGAARAERAPAPAAAGYGAPGCGAPAGGFG